MKKFSKFYYILLIVAITVMMTNAPVFAADNAQGSDTKKTKMNSSKMYDNYKGTLKGGYSILGSKFIGLNIENPQGENIGEVKDIMLDSTGRVSYVAVSYGGFMGMGDKMYTVPMDAFTFKRDSDSFYDNVKLILNVSKEQLKDDKGFDTKNWPDLNDEGYRRDLDKRYNINRSNMNN